MDLTQLAAMQREFDERHRGAAGSFYKRIEEGSETELEHLLVCLLGEAGEFANLVKKTVRGDYEYSVIRDELVNEWADMFIYIIKLANAMDVDLEAAYLEKLERNKKKLRRYERNG